ncbi:MAG TPA: hypothetical protein VHQ03_08360 [Candidatus Dormibacteraeota bacterium]|nr:hypothetical protein [Candidatus Dormibacteraeota bacterium]
MVRLGEIIEAVEKSWRVESLRLEVHSHDRQWKYWQRGFLRRLETEPQGHIVVARPDVCWSSSPDEGVVEHHNTTVSFFPAEGLVDLTGLLAANLTIADEADIAGRHAARLIAKLRPGASDLPSRWTLRNPETEIWVDVERGVGLKTSRLDVTEIAFDEALDDSLFEAPKPRSATSTPIRIALSDPRDLTQDEAIAESPLPLMTPTRLPAGTRLLTWKIWDSPQFKWIGAIYLVEPGPYCAIYLHLSDKIGPEAPDIEWHDFEIEGKRVSVARDERNPAAQSFTRHERNGVVVSLRSALPARTLAEIAASVQPL